MKWSNVKLIFFREVRDQLRDRRTLFTIAVLPLLLYPLLGMSFLQISQFLKEHPTKVRIIAGEDLKQIEPRLFDGDHFSQQTCPQDEVRRLLKLNVEPPLEEDLDVGELPLRARKDIRAGKYQLLIHFPRDFAKELDRFRKSLLARSDADDKSIPDASSIPKPNIYYDKADEKSRIAYQRVSGVLHRWREAIVKESLTESNIPLAATRPFELKNNDVADQQRRRAAMWSKILPFVVLIWALTGAFYPAIDLCAGEKERGTLETLLSSPAQRGEIVWGKMLTIMSFSMGTALLNMLSMGLTGLFVIRAFQGPAAGSIPFGPPPFTSMGWLVLAMIPISALFSALSLAIAAFARSSKEGQYYLMPLLLISLPLMMVPMLPSAELNLGTSLIPLTGMTLLLRCLIEGQYAQGLLYFVPVLAVTSVCCLLAIRWAIGQFNNESVLFRESERWSLGLWLRHLVRDRGDTPTAGQAILCGVVLLVIRFFITLIAKTPTAWGQFVTSTLILQIALIATPALLMAFMLTRSPKKTLLLRRPPWMALPAAILLASCLHPAIIELHGVIRYLYPIAEKNQEIVNNLLAQAPNIWLIVALLALTPAICEELAFRGYILSGLRHIGHKWTAIIVSSIFFGAIHGILQQSIAACLVGVVIGYLAVQTGSLLPCIFFHLTNNSIVFLVGHGLSQADKQAPLYGWFFRPVEMGYAFTWPVIGIGLVLSIGILLWFRRLPFFAYEEEKLQHALDHQTAQAASK